jgi:hypothetical protein
VVRFTFVAAGLLMLVGASSPVQAATLPPPGTVTLVGTAPNVFHSLHNYEEAFTTTWADPVNHLLFQYNAQIYYLCPGLVAMDMDTYAVKATLPGCGSSSGIGPVNPSGFSIAIAHAEDPAAHLMFAADNQGGPLVLANGGTAEIYVFDESTLKLRGKWTLPQPPDPAATPYAQVSGISYYAPLDELLVLEGNMNHPGAGAAVTAFSVSASMARNQAVALWTSVIPQCQEPLLPSFSQAAPYHATKEAALFVPCALEFVPPATRGIGINEASERDGIVKVPMTRSCNTTTCSGGCQVRTARECPDVSHASDAVAPGLSNDTVFDPTSDRIFLPSTSSGLVEVLVYDGGLNLFMGTVVAGSDTINTAIGFDPNAGRIYLVNSGGLWLMDARRTPVALFGNYPNLAKQEFPPNIFPVLPPDAAYPYTRVLVNNDIGSSNTESMPNYLVYADTSSGLAEARAADIDSNTLRGAPPAGALLQQTFHGVARGYGFHSDLVGGPNDLGNAVNAINSLQPGTIPNVTLPLGAGNRDLLGGGIENLVLRSGGAEGLASALGAADDSTNFQLQQCSDAQQIYACLQQPQCSSVPAPLPCSAPPGPPTKQPTGQLAPFPSAACSQPGNPNDARGQVDGGYYTTWSQTDSRWQPHQQQAPGLDSSRAHATVDCGAHPQGTSWLNGTRLESQAMPTVTVGAATTSSSVSQGHDTKGVVSTVTATARSIDVDLGSAGAVHIGEVVQTAATSAAGRPGTARATDFVVLSGVTINGTPICSNACDPSSIAQAINDAFPTQLHVAFPAADDTYMKDCRTNAAGARECNGSPGGYIAAVQANLPEQYGDQAFNGMTTEVASFLPAMRIVLYFSNDGNPSRTREVLDLAGVETESADGISALPPPPDLPLVALLPVLQEYMSSPVSGPGGVISTVNPQSTTSDVITSIVQRTFLGLRWRLRGPLQALQMVTFLAVLCAPLALALRRNTGTARLS